MERPQNLAPHLRQGKDPLQDSALGAGPGHSIYCAAGFVLTDSDSTRIVDCGHALESVGPHSGENDAAAVSPEHFRDRGHHHIS